MTGQEGDVVKLVYCISRKPGLTDAQLFDYWKNVHGPIGARIPGLRRLVQSHTLARTAEVRPPDFDGMAELWFDDMETLLAGRKTLEWQASAVDERHFIDPARVAFFVTEEHEIPLP